jgi:transglutaminase-like putative cysteine protease
MRLRIAHEIVTRFDPPCSGAIRTLRMNPRTYDGQYVGTWRLDVDQDCRLDRVFDAYGNVVQTFSVSGPLSALSILATGEVEVDNTDGVLPATARERIPTGVFRRSTPLTEPDDLIVALAARVRAAGGSMLDSCESLTAILAREVEHRPADPAAAIGPDARKAGVVLASGRGDGADVAHVFVAVARLLGAPARVVTGYLWRGDPRDSGEACHAWAEVFLNGSGWVGFDAPNGRCPTDAYVRVAAGLDKAGAAFVRGAEQGGGRVASVQCRAMITPAEL